MQWVPKPEACWNIAGGIAPGDRFPRDTQGQSIKILQAVQVRNTKPQTPNRRRSGAAEHWDGCLELSVWCFGPPLSRFLDASALGRRKVSPYTQRASCCRGCLARPRDPHTASGKPAAPCWTTTVSRSAAALEAGSLPVDTGTCLASLRPASSQAAAMNAATASSATRKEVNPVDRN